MNVDYIREELQIRFGSLTEAAKSLQTSAGMLSAVLNGRIRPPRRSSGGKLSLPCRIAEVLGVNPREVIRALDEEYAKRHAAV